MATVLRVSGQYEQLREALLAVPLDFTEAIASRKRRERRDVVATTQSTFNFTVSDAGGEQVPMQIAECEQFLSLHSSIIQRVREFDGVENMCLDFMWDFPRGANGQFNSFPHSLLRQCGSLGLDIKVSVYASDENNIPVIASEQAT